MSSNVEMVSFFDFGLEADKLENSGAFDDVVISKLVFPSPEVATLAVCDCLIIIFSVESFFLDGAIKLVVFNSSSISFGTDNFGFDAFDFVDDCVADLIEDALFDGDDFCVDLKDDGDENRDPSVS